MKSFYIFLSFIIGALSTATGYHFFEKTCHPFPNYQEKYKYKSILTPNKFLDRKKHLGRHPIVNAPKTLIICYDKHFMKQTLQKYKHKQCNGSFSDVYFLTEFPSVAIGNFGIFGPKNTMMMELAIVWGVKQVITIGTSCSLQKNITQDDILICEKSIRDEGTSHHYLPYSKYAYPSNKLKNKIIKKLDQLEIPYKSGISWTTDAFFRATKEEVSHYQKEGVMCIEAEAASLLSVAKFRGIDIAVMLTITDSYANLTWEKSKDYKYKKLETLDKMLEIALKVAD
ncbi:nucleoside phosphorylase [bacterium]|jgi:uridine phosphorylase|nr:nucleoside phosphorylase [bacterium]